MTPKISIMQGRLTPPFEGRFQAFPAYNWEAEFVLAQKLGIYSIEWIYEKQHQADNPLISDEGIKRIKEIIQKTGVQVKSICADYFMTELLISNSSIQKENVEHLVWLAHQAQKLNIVYMVIPFVDQSSVKTDFERKLLTNLLEDILKKTEHLGIEIHLEMDLPPKQFRKIFIEVPHSCLKMNYDIGNSASLGYKAEEEMQLLGDFLGSVHVKDRLLNGTTVPLGTGNAELSKCFEFFKKLNFDRWYVLQVARGQVGDEFLYIQSVLAQVKGFIDGSKSYA